MSDLIIDFDSLSVVKVEKAFDRAIAKVQQLHQAIQSGGGLPGIRTPKPPQSFGSQMMKVLASSRFGMSGGGLQLMPLIGQVAKLTGPVGMVALAAIAAGKALFDLTRSAAEAGVEFAKLSFASGGGSSTGALSALGNAIGVNLGEQSRKLNEQMMHNPYAMMSAGGMGISPDFTPGGGSGMGANLLKYMEGLRKIDREQGRAVAIQKAYAAGMEDLLPALSLSDKQIKALNTDVAVKGGLFSDAFQRNAADFMSALGRLGDSLKDLVVGVFGPMLPTFTQAINGIANGIRAITIGMIMLRPALSAIGELILSMGAGFMGNIPEAMKYIANAIADVANPSAWKKAQDDAAKIISDMNKAITDNTKATMDNTEQTKRQGTFGGGSRAAGAIPAGWGPMNQHVIVSEAYRLGLF